MGPDDNGGWNGEQLEGEDRSPAMQYSYLEGDDDGITSDDMQAQTKMHGVS